MDIKEIIYDEINANNIDDFISFIQCMQITNGLFEGNHYNFRKITTNTIICYNGIGHEYINYDVSKSIKTFNAFELLEILKNLKV